MEKSKIEVTKDKISTEIVASKIDRGILSTKGIKVENLGIVLPEGNLTPGISKEEIETKFEAMNSVIAQLAGEVANLKQSNNAQALSLQDMVKKNEIISQINLSTEEIRISGNKITIDGETLKY